MKTDWLSKEFYEFLISELKHKSKREIIKENQLDVSERTLQGRITMYLSLGSPPPLKSVIQIPKKKITLSLLQAAISEGKHINVLAAEGFSIRQINALVKRHKLSMPRFDHRSAQPVDMDKFHELFKAGVSATIMAGFLNSSKTNIDRLINLHYPKPKDPTEVPVSALMPPEIKAIITSRW